MEADCILLVDDDQDILRILADNLELDRYVVAKAGTGRDALKLFEAEAPALIVLDLSLPDMDGIQVCRVIRAKSDVPIIMLTARDRIPDKVLGLESGADDYLVKPFDYLELAARIRVCLRRTRRVLETDECIEFGDIRIDTRSNAVWKAHDRVDLTGREYELLVLLARNAGKVMSRAVIRQTLWPHGELYRDSRAIDVHIQHLRSKLETTPGEPRFIMTVPGVGYVLSLPEA